MKVVFSLSALWWRRIRGLWQLPDGIDWLRGIMGLVLISRAMLSNSLTQFSVFGWSCVPSLLFTWGRTIVEVMKIMLKVKWSEVAQSCPTLSDLMDCSPPGSSVHGIFQARVLEWGAIACFDNGILLSHKKECIWVSSNEVEEPRAYYTQWSKSEREILILYTDAYIWNLKRWYWWTYFQGSNVETDLWTWGKGGGWKWVVWKEEHENSEGHI